MANMQQTKTPMPEQKPDVRNKNFLEVALGYTSEDAINEAKRCLNCKHRPCVKGCPVSVYIPEFITLVAEGKFKEAYEKVTETNSLPAVCGRVCPQETQCEKYCVRGIKGEPVGIGRLERFVADYYIENYENEIKQAPKNGYRVAVVGGGPASLTCAGSLAKMGYAVTLYEAFHKPGGVLVYGIPEFRLPKALVQKEIDTIKEYGVKIELNSVVGKFVTIEELMKEEDYSAVFIGTGAGLPSFMKIPGENLNCVYSANEFLTRINLMTGYKFPYTDTPVKVGKKVAVVGGGNVAMDAARSAKRLGAEEVYIIYRRSMDEMPARLEEIHHAEEEGIIFKTLTNPIEILGTEDGYVRGLKCVEMELGEPDQSGRRRPSEKKDSEFKMEMDTVVIAIGQSPNPLIKDTTKDLAVNKWGGIIADEETGETSIPGVYAGGDVVTGAATVILAMGAGRNSAKAIDKYIKSLDNC
jgi:glutamate synthase (NADPH/NADH) small chain